MQKDQVNAAITALETLRRVQDEICKVRSGITVYRAYVSGDPETGTQIEMRPVTLSALETEEQHLLTQLGSLGVTFQNA